MKREVLCVLLLLGGSVTPLMAQQSLVPAATQDPPLAEETTDATKTADAAKKDENEKVCKIIAVTGSRFKSRQCHTQHEWDAIDRATRDKMREIDSQPIGQKSEGSGFLWPSDPAPPA